MVFENGSPTYTYKIQNLSPGTTYQIDVGYENNYGHYYYTPKLSITTDEATGPLNYNVIFNSDGGTEVDNQSIPEEGKVTEPTPPTRVNHVFEGWYTTLQLGTLYDFSSIVKNNLSLYARWTNIAPTSLQLSSSKLDENRPAGTLIGTLSSTSAGSNPVYSLVSGLGDTDNGLFTIEGDAIKSSETFDYESKSFYTIRVKVTGVSNSTLERMFFIDINDLDELAPNIPSSLSLEKVYSTSADIRIGFASDNVGVTKYEVFVNGNLVGTFPRQEDTSIYTYTVTNLAPNATSQIEVRAVDAAGNTSPLTTPLLVSTSEQAPTGPTNVALSNSTVAENVALGTTVGILSAIDPKPGATFTYSLVSGVGGQDNDKFLINGNQLKLASSLNYEDQSLLQVRVQVSNGSQTLVKAFSIVVTDVFEPKYKDIPANKWFSQPIEFLSEKQIVNGYANGDFRPSEKMTRAEFITMIVRGFAITPSSTDAMSFKDVTNPSVWYYDAMLNAYRAKLLFGFSDGTMKPNEFITREQALVILRRAMAYQNLPLPNDGPNLSNYSDANQVLPPFVSIVSEMVRANVVNGTDGMLRPSASLTRAEAATFLYRTLKLPTIAE
jgi:uncharacterized repeat protein (TIGR02543 family)